METYLKHYGIIGMRWGIRRFRNPDGTLTQEGKDRRARDLNQVAKAKYKYNKSKSEIDNYRKTDEYKNDQNPDKDLEANKNLNDLSARYAKQAGNFLKKWRDTGVADITTTVAKQRKLFGGASKYATTVLRDIEGNEVESIIYKPLFS